MYKISRYGSAHMGSADFSVGIWHPPVRQNISMGDCKIEIYSAWLFSFSLIKTNLYFVFVPNFNSEQSILPILYIFGIVHFFAKEHSVSIHLELSIQM